jgi:hypothetical protein
LPRLTKWQLQWGWLRTHLLLLLLLVLCLLLLLFLWLLLLLLPWEVLRPVLLVLL